MAVKSQAEEVLEFIMFMLLLVCWMALF